VLSLVVSPFFIADVAEQKIEDKFFSAGLNGGGGETPSKESPLEDSSSLPFPKKKKRTPIEKAPPLLENGHGSEAGDIAVETAEQEARREAAKKSTTPVKIRSFKRNMVPALAYLWVRPNDMCIYTRR
jgi:hypothetical protein